MEGVIILVGAVSGSIVSIIYSVFSAVRKSRCVEVNCCGFSCKRELMNEAEMKLDYNMSGGGGGTNAGGLMSLGMTGGGGGLGVSRSAPEFHPAFSRDDTLTENAEISCETREIGI